MSGIQVSCTLCGSDLRLNEVHEFEKGCFHVQVEPCQTCLDRWADKARDQKEDEDETMGLPPSLLDCTLCGTSMAARRTGYKIEGDCAKYLAATYLCAWCGTGFVRSFPQLTGSNPALAGENSTAQGG